MKIRIIPFLLLTILAGCAAPAESTSESAKAAQAESAPAEQAKEQAESAPPEQAIEQAAESAPAEQAAGQQAESAPPEQAIEQAAESAPVEQTAEQQAETAPSGHQAIEVYAGVKGSGQGLYVDELKFPALSKALEAWDNSEESAAGKLYVQRADGRFLSFMQHIGVPSEPDGNGGYYAGYEHKLGWNFDTETGERVRLSDVVTDLTGFRAYLEETIFRDAADEEHRKGAEEILDAYFGQKKIVSGESIAWTIGYEGLNFYLNEPDSWASVAGRDRAAIHLFLPYAGHEALFTEKVLDAPDAWLQQVLFDSYYTEAVMTDPDGDGTYEEVTAYPEMKDGDGEEFAAITIWGTGEKTFPINHSENCPSAWYLRAADGGSWFYFQQGGEEERNVLYIAAADGAGEPAVLEDATLRRYNVTEDMYTALCAFNPAEFMIWQTTGSEEGDAAEMPPEDEEPASWYNMLAGVGGDGRPVPAERKIVIVHPHTQDNVQELGGGFRVIDDESGDAYFLDRETILNPYGGFPAREEGDDAVRWMERFRSGDPTFGEALGMGDLIECIVDGDHIDEILDIYWWD